MSCSALDSDFNTTSILRNEPADYQASEDESE